MVCTKAGQWWDCEEKHRDVTSIGKGSKVDRLAGSKLGATDDDLVLGNAFWVRLTVPCASPRG